MSSCVRPTRCAVTLNGTIVASAVDIAAVLRMVSLATPC